MCSHLPPGFRFLPSDEEILIHFLHYNFIPNIHPSFLHPSQLASKAFCSGNHCYFFTQLCDYNNNNSVLVTQNGYWKRLDVEEEEPVFTSTGHKIGVKMFFVFFEAAQTNWVMLMYRRFLPIPPNDCYEWVLCRVYERRENVESVYGGNDDDYDDDGTELSCLDEMFLSLDDDLAEISLPTD